MPPQYFRSIPPPTQPLVADIQKNMEKYRGATAITPNQPDSEKQVGYFIKDEATLVSAGEKLLEELELQKVLLTS